MVEPLRLDNVIVHVPNVPAAAAWYHEHIGLTPILVTNTIAVLHPHDHGPGICLKHDSAAIGKSTIWFEVADARNLADQFNVTPQHIRTGWVIEIRDPWGNTIGLTDYNAPS